MYAADFTKGEDAFASGDYSTALKEWKPLAEQGDATAQFALGTMYMSGIGVTQDYKTTLKWFKLAFAAVIGSSAELSYVSCGHHGLDLNWWTPRIGA